MNQKSTGISNRETPDQEGRERREHPPEGRAAAPDQDAEVGVDDDASDEVSNLHSTQKVGMKAVGQKGERTKYPDHSMPQTRKKAGAFGKEPHDTPSDESSS